MSIHAANLKLRDELFMAMQAIARVRDLHKPATYADGVVICMAENCHESRANYPCETIRALDGEQG